MSFNNGSTINRKGSVDSASRKENFNKLRNIFEIKRPSKSPNSTLRKSKSIPSLISPTLEDERGFSRENIFMRSNSTCPIDKRTKHRKGSHESCRETRYIKTKSEVYDTSTDTNTDALVKELKLHLKKQQKAKHNTRKGNLDIDNCSLYEAVYQEYSKKTDDDNNFDQNPEIEATEVFQMLQSERKYRRNNTKYYVTSPYNSLGRKAKAAKEKRESRQVKSFIEADQKGQTEEHRNSLVQKIDHEVAKMKYDGFLDELENISDTSKNNTQNQTEYDSSSGNTEKEKQPFSKRCSIYKQLFDELDKNLKMVEDRCKLEIASQSVNVEEVYSQDLQDALLSDDESFHVEAEETDKNTEIAEKNYVNVSAQAGEIGNVNTHEEIRNEVENTKATEENYVNVAAQTEETANVNTREKIIIKIENTEVAEENYINEDISDNNQVIASCSRNELGEINENEIEKEQTTEEKAHIQANESGKADENYDYWEETTEGEENVKITAAHNLSICQRQNFKDDFAESLGEDLENGAFFVEAYNDSGRELVIVEISIERKTVDFDKLESIRNSIKNADIVFHQSEGQILNLVEEPVYENMEILSNGNDLGSNRSTIYSITSRESGVFDDDDEGISMGHTEGKASVGEDNTYNNVRRETFWDNRGIVRIERVGCPGVIRDESFADPHSPVSRNNSFAQKSKLSYIIEEIKSTEKKYVADLEKVIKKYIPYIDKHTPPDKQGRQYYIFGNMLTLWEHQKGFLAALENCVEEAEEIARTFIDFKDLFKLYPKYFKNKPKADVVLKEFSPIIKQAQERFKERLDLSAYLLTPLQRLGKYKLFLENIEKQLFKLNLPSDSTTTALEIIKQEMSKGNDSVAIASIDSSPIDKSEYGSFKMREIFIVLRPRRFEAMIFLFENLIVFTTLGSPKNSEMYNYHDSIKMNDLRIATFEDSTIHLTDFTKSKKAAQADRFTYVLEAKTEKIKDAWRKAIEDILWEQLYKVKENTLRMYQTHGNKKSKMARNRIKSIGKSSKMT